MLSCELVFVLNFLSKDNWLLVRKSTFIPLKLINSKWQTESDYPNPEAQDDSQVRRMKSERIIKEYTLGILLRMSMHHSDNTTLPENYH